MKRVLFVLTIILSLISCTTEVTKTVYIENDKPKKLFQYKVTYRGRGTYDNIPDDFICESGYVLTEEDLPTIKPKKFEEYFTGWNGGKITNGYKVTSDLVLSPTMVKDEKYRYFLRYGDFYFDENAELCSKPIGALLDSVPCGEVDVYSGGSSFLSLYSRHDIFSTQTYLRDYIESDASPSLFDNSEIVGTRSDIDTRDSICIQEYPSLCNAIDRHSLYTNLDLTFSVDTEETQYFLYYAQGQISPSIVFPDSNFYLILEESNEKAQFTNVYRLFFNSDGCVYAMELLIHANIYDSVGLLYNYKDNILIDSWEGDWSNRDNEKTPIIVTLKIKDLFLAGSKNRLLHQYNPTYDSLNDTFYLYWETIPSPFDAITKSEKNLLSNFVYKEVWHLD